MKICIAGKNSIAVDIAKYLRLNYPHIELLAIVNKTDDGINKFQPSFKNYITINNIKEITLNSAYGIKKLLFLSLEFDRLIKIENFSTKELFNIHFSYLPEYKGMYTSALPILHGKKYSGVTLHKIDNGIDTGGIIAQYKFFIKDSGTSRDLYHKYLSKGKELIIKNINNLIKKTYSIKPQSILNSSYYSKLSINYCSLEIDFNKTAYQVVNQVRAFAFREYQLPEAFGFEFCNASILNQRSFLKPGSIVENTFDKIIVSSIDFDVVLYKDLLKYFMDASAKGDLNTVSHILPFLKDINEKDKNGWTALIVATYNNNIDIVNYLIEKQADINIVNNNGTSLLMYAKDAALITKNYALIDRLMQLGLSLNYKDFFGKTVLDYVLVQDENLYNYLISKK